MGTAGNQITFSASGNQYIVDGDLIGNTLVLTTQGGQTVNIPLPSGGVDFANLNQTQKDALFECIRGDLVLDLAGDDRGYLLPL